LTILRISVENIQDLLKSDKKNDYFALKPISSYDNIPFSSS